MPRQNRRLSKSSMYHVMLRGNERKEIFIDEEDKLRIIDTLEEKKRKQEYYLYAYCLMDNHAHLLIKEGKDNISRAMKRIQTSYAYYFNKKYNRVGHVFQGRYRSEAIEDERYLLSVVRYIHNNPVHAGMVKNAAEYKWSSYNTYMNNSYVSNNIINRVEILKIFSEDEQKALKLFAEFTKENDKGTYIDLEEENQRELNRKTAKDVVRVFLEAERKEMSDIKQDKVLRDKLIRILKEKSNVSIRQIAELIGVNRNIIQRAK